MKTVVIDGKVPVKEHFRTTVAEAIDECRRKHPGIHIERINGRYVIGWCEVCGAPLYDGSRFYLDVDGVLWCKKHGA